MEDKRIGSQLPTKSVVLPYESTKGFEAVNLYEQSGRSSISWQQLLCCDIMAQNSEGLWIHQKFGYAVPRRNGKNEVLTMREFWGLENGEQICHTAHRQTTATAAFNRLHRILLDSGYVEWDKRHAEEQPEKSFHAAKSYGLEAIEFWNGARAVFRTRSANGGLGEGFDLLIIDEAQEYTVEQEGALVYTVSDSSNPQTLFCGTPPTLVSAGTVFQQMRIDTLTGKSYDTGWAEWSVDEKPNNIEDVESWYLTNPSIGYHLDERKIRSEIRGDTLDFIIQRLGYWFTYNLQSAITKEEWLGLQCKNAPVFTGKLFVGIKYGHDGTNVSMSVAVKTESGKVFVECIGCESIRRGNSWIISFLRNADIQSVAIDGASGSKILETEIHDFKLKLKPILPTVKEVIFANATFEQGLYAGNICHNAQESLTDIVSNCEKRQIGSNGGFGYKSQIESLDISVMDSMILAYWQAVEHKEKTKQIINY